MDMTKRNDRKYIYSYGDWLKMHTDNMDTKGVYAIDASPAVNKICSDLFFLYKMGCFDSEEKPKKKEDKLPKELKRGWVQ